MIHSFVSRRAERTNRGLLVAQLAELKQECLARGLEAKGNKQDLINRLQAYLEEHGGCCEAPPAPSRRPGGGSRRWGIPRGGEESPAPGALLYLRLSK